MYNSFTLAHDTGKILKKPAKWRIWAQKKIEMEEECSLALVQDVSCRVIYIF